jgi:hypothetical protein
LPIYNAEVDTDLNLLKILYLCRYNISTNAEKTKTYQLKMTIKQLIKNISSIENDYSVAFAKKIDGEFKSDSIVIVADIDEESDEDISKSVIEKNPEFSYFLEVFLIKEMVEDLREDLSNLDELVNRVIHYAKYDA